MSASTTAVAGFPSARLAHLTEHLPDELLLRILCQLGADDVRACACASPRLARVAADESLWRGLLERESAAWTRLERDRCPDSRGRRAGDSRRVFLACRPPQPRPQLQAPSVWSSALSAGCQRLMKAARQLADRCRSPPSVGLTGPGIESNRTGGLVHGQIHQMMLLKPTRLPAGTRGVGAGLACQLPTSGRCLQLVTLHSSRQDERGRQPSEADRVRASILLGPAAGETGAAAGDRREYQVIPAVARLQLDALVYAVDADTPASELSACRPELDAFARAMRPGRPVLVLAVSGSGGQQRPQGQQRRLTCLQVARSLGLADGSALSDGRPWLAQACDSVDQLTEQLPICLDWLLDSSA